MKKKKGRKEVNSSKEGSERRGKKENEGEKKKRT